MEKLPSIHEELRNAVSANVQIEVDIDKSVTIPNLMNTLPIYSILSLFSSYETDTITYDNREKQLFVIRGKF
jgi:hypothetical protein